VTVLDYQDPEYWRALRNPKATNPWPPQDPAPTVTTRDPRPAGVTEPASVVALVKLAEVNGWQCRVGYSRAARRGVKLGTFRDMEAFTVWFSLDGTHRPFGAYERFVDARECRRWSVGGWDLETPAAGTPGAWAWRCNIAGTRFIHVTVSQLKEFIKVRGSVLPSWFDQIIKEQAVKRAAEKAKARTRTKKTEDGS
jgi:hypothetical protein